MYRCEVCKSLVPPNTPSYRVVTETRPAQYPRRVEANTFKKNGKNEKSDDPGGKGVEIAQERVMCPRCAGRT